MCISALMDIKNVQNIFFMTNPSFILTLLIGPLPGKPSFTSYVKSGFNDSNQIELAEFFKECSDYAKLMLSNSDTKDGFFEGQYKDHYIEYVWARRNVNSDGTKRGKVGEIIVTNYPVKTQTKLELGKD